MQLCTPSFSADSSDTILRAPLLLSVSTILSQWQPALAVFCSLNIVSPSSRSKDYYCSVLPENLPGTMTCWLLATEPYITAWVLRVSCGCQCLSKPCKTSPVKNSNFHPMSPPHLHHEVRVVLDFVLSGKLVRSTIALYAVSVRRCRTLPSAAFRFHLTMDTLAVQLMVPTTNPIADFHRLVTAHAGQTRRGMSPIGTYL